MLLLGVSVVLLITGLLFGTEVAPDPSGPQRESSPMARRTLAEVLAMRGPSVSTGSAETAGTIVEGTITSHLLGRELPYAVYLPPGYESSTERYPVLYALHGVGGSYVEWIGFGATDAAERLFTGRAVPPFIMVFPEGGQSYWFNHADGAAWADYLTEEVVPHIDWRFRTIASREGRAVGGLSMGATAALQLGLRRPDLFSVIGAHSPSFRTDVGVDPEDFEIFQYFRDPSAYRPYDPFELARDARIEPASLRIWLDVGHLDPWLDTVERFHELLVARQIAHQYSIGSGAHEMLYWTPRLDQYLTFYGYALDTVTP